MVLSILLTKTKKTCHPDYCMVKSYKTIKRIMTITVNHKHDNYFLFCKVTGPNSQRIA